MDIMGSSEEIDNYVRKHKPWLLKHKLREGSL